RLPARACATRKSHCCRKSSRCTSSRNRKASARSLSFCAARLRRRSPAQPIRSTAAGWRSNAQRTDGFMIEFLARTFGGDKTEKPKQPKHINLALQGGGALGAFTWGVLD